MLEESIDLDYTPHRYQLEVHHALSEYRFAVLVCHRRFGKTLLAVMTLLDAALRCTKPDPRFAYVAPRLKQARQIAWLYLASRARKVPHSRVNASEGYVEFPNGARITLYGASDGNEEAMRGLYMDGAVIDEVAGMKPHVWDEIMRPALSDRQGWALFIGTPHGMDYFHEVWQRAQQDPEWFTGMYRVDEVEITWWEGDPKAEIESQRERLPDASFRQEYLCVRAGTLIYTPRGQVPIESLSAGDLVLSHKGRFRQVTRTYERRYSGELVGIRSYGDHELLWVTPEHPVRVADPSRQSYRWIPASEIRTDHWVVRPRRRSTETLLPSPWVEMIGWFICEGSIGGNAVNLAVGVHEPDHIEAIRKLIAAFGVRANESVLGSVHQFAIASTALADFLVDQCGKLAHNKRIPWSLIQGHEQRLYDVLMAGDGCRFGELDVYVTVSPHLARDVQMLSGMLGMRAGISRKRGGPSQIMGREVETRDKYEVRISRKLSRKAYTRCMKNGVATRVREVRRMAYTGPVYNLEVQSDHTYVAAGRAVHNCDFSAAAENALITIDLVSKAASRELLEKDFFFAPKVIGVDVARFGDDRSVIMKRQGLYAWDPIVFQDVDNMTLAGHVAAEIDQWKPDAVFVDAGRGEGVIDRLRQLKFRVTEVNFGGKSVDPHFHDKRTEMWMGAKVWLEQGGCIPNDPELKTDLCGPTYEYTAAGKVRMESKDKLKERGLRSSDLGDALALTFAMPVAKHQDRLGMAQDRFKAVTA